MFVFWFVVGGLWFIRGVVFVVVLLLFFFFFTLGWGDSLKR